MPPAMSQMSKSATLKPPSRRPGTFSLTPVSTDASSTSDAFPDGASEPSTPDMRDGRLDGLGREQSRESSVPPKTSRSLLNLTSSTLFGIFNYSGFDSNRDEPPTPYGTMTPALGTGSQTPARSSSIDYRNGLGKAPPLFTEEMLKEKAEIHKERRQERRKSELQQQTVLLRRRSPALRLSIALLRLVLLFACGVGYGFAVAHLHDEENIAPVKVDKIDRRSRLYLGFWGAMAVALGSLMPWVDGRWPRYVRRLGDLDTDVFEETSGIESDDDDDSDDRQASRHPLGAEWNPMVRSVGAFVGIAYAIRKLPWQSTLQVSLTLALVNPFLWYLMDRTRVGFVLASITGIMGAAILLSINPDWVPSPATSPAAQNKSSSVWGMVKSTTNPSASASQGSAWDQDLLLSMLSSESLGVATWVASVLFCSCIIFGNIGRRLSSDL